MQDIKTMTEHRYTVEVQPDFLRRQSKTKPIQAIAELIWNGLDADASSVDVQLERTELGIDKIIIQDNGHGIPHQNASQLFTCLGGSWKKTDRQIKKGRMLHGYQGQGRFKAFALGRVVVWRVMYRNNIDELRGYEISMLEDKINEVRITNEDYLHAETTGVKVTIEELHKQYRSLDPDKAVQELTEIFALYLKNYQDVLIQYDDRQLDPKTAIAKTFIKQLNNIDEDNIVHPVELEIIEWRNVTARGFYLCTEQGFPHSKVATRFHIDSKFNFSAYLKSSYITKLYYEAQLDLAEMNPLLNMSIAEAQKAIKEYFCDLAADRTRAIVETWKMEKVYPYEGEAQSPLEDAERKLFEMLAVTASEYMPDFTSEAKTRVAKTKKAFDLRMLRTAIEKSPEELQVILKEVVGLPKRKREELAGLLREASLSSIISAAKIVADRLKFLAGLEQILFDTDFKKRLKERSQLHKIIEDNTWLFGEEYNLSVSDRGLTKVLEKHQQIISDDIIIYKPVKHISQARGIVDLMLSRTLRRHRAEEVEHLIVELKRPRIKIGPEETTQIEKYAISVAKDERFRRANGVKWTFWAISDDIDDYANYRIGDGGVISSNNNIIVGIKTWGQIIDENRARLQFFQEKLEHQVDDETALKYLQERYQKCLAGVVTEEESGPERRTN